MMCGCALVLGKPGSFTHTHTHTHTSLFPLHLTPLFRVTSRSACSLRLFLKPANATEQQPSSLCVALRGGWRRCFVHRPIERVPRVSSPSMPFPLARLEVVTVCSRDTARISTRARNTKKALPPLSALAVSSLSPLWTARMPDETNPRARVWAHLLNPSAPHS